MSTIVLKIDVTKVEKERLFPGKNGAKYLDLVLIERDDDYGNNYMVVQGVSKEERENGVKGPILGNGKILGGYAKQPPRTKRSAPPQKNEDQDCPF